MNQRRTITEQRERTQRRNLKVQSNSLHEFCQDLIFDKIKCEVTVQINETFVSIGAIDYPTYIAAKGVISDQFPGKPFYFYDKSKKKFAAPLPTASGINR